MGTATEESAELKRLQRENAELRRANAILKTGSAFFAAELDRPALDRTQPSLPMKPGRAGTMTHDYKRNGTIDLFAALNVATGEVLTDLRKGHTGADVLRFFKQIDAAVPRDLDVHVILDNLSAHSTPEIVKWLAHKDRRRWNLHFTPTSSSWLNLIERWFKKLTDKRLRRGAFSSVAALTAAIITWAEHWNRDPQALRVEGHRRRHHRQSPTRTRHPSPDQIADGPPVRLRL